MCVCDVLVTMLFAQVVQLMAHSDEGGAWFDRSRLETEPEPLLRSSSLSSALCALQARLATTAAAAPVADCHASLLASRRKASCTCGHF